VDVFAGDGGEDLIYTPKSREVYVPLLTY